MAVQLTLEPDDDITVCNQHLLYELFDSAATPDRYIVQVYEAADIFAGDGTSIAKIYITPNAVNRGVFDLSDIVGNRLLPAETISYQGNEKFAHDLGVLENPTSTSKSVRKYTVKAGVLNGGTETFPNNAAANAVVFLMGGAFQIADGRHPSFSQYYTDAIANTAKAWLTNMPNNSQVIEKYMADEDQGRAQIMQHTLMGVTSYLNQIRYNLYRPGTNTVLATKTITVTTQISYPAAVRYVPIGPANLANFFGNLWDNSWGRVEITPLSAGSTQLGAKLIIYRDCRPLKHQPVQLAWTNTVGGWDLLRFDSRAPKTIQKNEKRYRKDPLDWQSVGPNWNTWDRGTTTFQNEGKIRFTLNHEQFTADERALLEYCMRSKRVYYRYGTNDWAPCVVDTNSLVIEPAGSRMYRVSLTIEDANPVRC